MGKKSDTDGALLDHLLEEAGIEPGSFRAAASDLAGKPERDVDAFLNEHFYGRERRFLRAMVLAIAGGA